MKLHLGSGSIIKEGWLNIDQKELINPHYLQWDLKKGLPFQCKDITYTYSSHFIEHLIWKDAIQLLKECREKMIEGSVMRVCLPNFKNLVIKYLEKDWNFFTHCLHVAPNRQLMQIINYAIYQRDDGINAEHVCMYDSEYAIFTLEVAGFRKCKEVEFNKEIDCESRRPYSFFVEGIK